MHIENCSCCKCGNTLNLKSIRVARGHRKVREIPDQSKVRENCQRISHLACQFMLQIGIKRHKQVPHHDIYI